MLNNKNFDFSQESNIKKALFDKMKLEYEQARRMMPLSDDELDFVAAAGSSRACSRNVKCERCVEHKNGKCSLGLNNNRRDDHV